MPFGSKLHIPSINYHLQAAQQEPYNKSNLTEKDLWEKKIRRMDHWQENDETERARRLGTKTRLEKGKGSQMTALRLQTGGQYQTSGLTYLFSNLFLGHEKERSTLVSFLGAAIGIILWRQRFGRDKLTFCRDKVEEGGGGGR